MSGTAMNFDNHNPDPDHHGDQGIGPSFCDCRECTGAQLRQEIEQEFWRKYGCLYLRPNQGLFRWEDRGVRKAIQKAFALYRHEPDYVGDATFVGIKETLIEVLANEAPSMFEIEDLDDSGVEVRGFKVDDYGQKHTTWKIQVTLKEVEL